MKRADLVFAQPEKKRFEFNEIQVTYTPLWLYNPYETNICEYTHIIESKSMKKSKNQLEFMKRTFDRTNEFISTCTFIHTSNLKIT